jgi:outer membrane protein OmpA-like peptidoglycan-associated protein/tetratricopeptide (TPR) repeat protein
MQFFIPNPMKTFYRLQLLSLFLIISPLQSKAQDSLAIAQEMYNMGIELFDFATRKQAKEMFVQATEFNPKFAEAHLMAGKAVLLTVHKEEALPYLLAAYKLNPQVDEEILYLIGQANQYSESFDDAIIAYEAYRKTLGRSLSFDRSRKIYDVDWKIFESRNAKIYIANPVDVDIINLSENINTEYSEYAPLVSADEKTLIFTSRRPDNTNPDLAEDFEFYEDIYRSKFENGQWQPAVAFPAPINGNYHNSDIALSTDGTVLYIYTDENGGDILVSKKVDGEWSTPKPLKGLINTPYRESSATITNDKNIMYFTSDKPGGYGGTDIYVSKRDNSGRWGKPVNLGNVINTERDEEGPFISKSGKNLYFSSNGHAGMGDLDIYMAIRGDKIEEFGKPVNLGYPINSVENDVYFVLSGDEKSAYYSSVKSTSKGEQDIYKIYMARWQPINIDSLAANEVIEVSPLEPPPVAANPAPPISEPFESEISLLLTVLDAQSLDTLTAKVALIEQKEQKVIGATLNDKGTYEIKFTNADHTAYKAKIIKEDYLPYESMIYVIGKERRTYEIHETVALKRIEVAQTGIMNVYFGHDSALPNGYEDIQYLEFLMKGSPNVTVEISGHTDNTGDVNYNKILSQRRADAIKNYLTEHGIDAFRITSKGYGIEKPIGDNSTRIGRRLNRRTEFKILER